MRLILILNRNAGALQGVDAGEAGEDLAGIFRKHGHEVSVEVLEGAEACSAIERTCGERSYDAIVAGGGDGTISSAAAAAAKNGMVLGILPLGTMNLFARSLGIPLEMTAAAQALATAETVRVDICEVNGRHFVHHVTLGLHARMILLRQGIQYRSRLGKIGASIRAWWIVVRQPPALDVRIRADDREFACRTAAILVTNNPLGEGHMPYADDPRLGMLGLYVAKSLRPQDLFSLAVRMLLGMISTNPLLESWVAREVDIALARPSVTVSVDGEILTLETPLRCRLREGGLRVLRPRTGGDPASVGSVPRL